MHRDDPGADLVADHDDRPRAGRSIAASAAATGPSRIGSIAGGIVAEEGAEPEREAVDQDRLVGLVRAMAAARSVPTSIVGQAAGRARAVAGDPVVELGVARPGRRQEPDAPAVAGQPCRGGQAEPALAAARAAEGQDQRLSHAAPRARLIAATRRGDERRPPRVSSIDRAEPVAVELAPRRAHDRDAAANPDADPERPAERTRRDAASELPRRPTTASRRATAATTASAGPTRAANQAPNPAARDASPGEQDRDDRERPADGRGDDERRAATARPPAVDARLASAATSAASTRMSATAPPGPTAGSLRARSARAGSGARSASAVSASPSRWSAPVRTVIAATASRLARTGSAAPSQRRAARRPTSPTSDADDRERGRAARHLVGRADREPGQQRERGTQRPADRARARRRAIGRARRDRRTVTLKPRPTGRRTSAGSTPKTPADMAARRACVAGGPSATIRPALMSGDAREEVGGEGQVVEDRDDRRAVALVEVDEQLHDLDLVADVEVGGRLVEDEDRRRLGEGDGDEHELALAQRQASRVAVGKVADADPLDRGVDRRPRRPRAARGAADRAAGARARRPRGRVIANGSWASSGTTAIERATRLRSSVRDRLAGERDASRPRVEDAGQDAQQGRLAGAVRSDQGEPLAGPSDRLASATIVALADTRR